MKLSLEAGQLAQAKDLPLQVQSVSPAGLIVLTADRPPEGFDEHLLGSRAAEGIEPLVFVFENNSGSKTLQASLVWVELSGGDQHERRLELIIDTGDDPGWWEVQTAVAEA